MDELVSVIIPAYNAEDFISRALDSLIAQTYENWQAIVVDDGSVDGTAEICKSYRRKDERFVCISKENGGVSAARNTGIENAEGKYICFLDADDFFEPHYIEVLCKAISSDGVMISGCDFARNTKDLCCKNNELKSYTIEQAFYQMCRNKIIYPFLWNKMFCASVIKENLLKFDADLIYGEDTLFVLKYYACIYDSRLLYSENCLYHYTFNRNSAILKREKTGFEPSWTDQIKALERAVEYAKEKGLDSFADAVKIRITYVCPMVLDLFVIAKCRNEEYKLLLSRLRSGLDIFLKSDLFDSRTKRQIRVCAFSPKLKHIMTKLKLL